MENVITSLRDLGWGAEIIAAVTLTLIIRYIAMRMLEAVKKRLRATETLWDDALFNAVHKPLSWFILIYGLIWTISISDGYLDTDLFSDSNLGVMRQLAFISHIAWFLLRFIAMAEQRLLESIKTKPDDETSLDATTLQALTKLFRLSVIISATLIALPTFGIEVTALLAAGGVGGIAIGFAAQDLLANFFGGLMIYLDRPFAIGDWIRSPDREIEGTVERIGWRLTVVRTFDKRPLYIPNAIFNKLALENPSRMTNRRIYEKIGIRYSDSEKMGPIVADVKAMLKQHKDIENNLTMIVNFNSYAASSLEFFVYTFTKTTNWIEFHEIKQDVLLKIVEIVHQHGADFAFPTTTLDGLDVLNQVRPEPSP